MKEKVLFQVRREGERYVVESNLGKGDVPFVLGGLTEFVHEMSRHPELFEEEGAADALVRKITSEVGELKSKGEVELLREIVEVVQRLRRGQ